MRELLEPSCTAKPLRGSVKSHNGVNQLTKERVPRVVEVKPVTSVKEGSVTARKEEARTCMNESSMPCGEGRGDDLTS